MRRLLLLLVLVLAGCASDKCKDAPPGMLIDCGPGRVRIEETRGDVCHQECVDAPTLYIHGAEPYLYSSSVELMLGDFAAPFTGIELTQRGTAYNLVQDGELVAVVEFSPLRVTVLRPTCVRALGGGWVEYVGPVDCKEDSR